MNVRREDFEWNAVGAGALTAIAICLPVSIVGKLLVDDPEHSSVTPVVFLAVLAGFAVGGWVAAKRAESPYTAALLSSLFAFFVIEAITIISLLIRDEEINVIVIISNAFFAYASGLLGAAIVARSRTT